MNEEEEIMKILESTTRKVHYRTEDDVVADLGEMIDMEVDFISNFNVAKQDYEAADFVGFLKRMIGEDTWEALRDEGESNFKYAQRQYEHCCDYVRDAMVHIEIVNRLAMDADFIKSMVGSNRVQMVKKIIDMQVDEEQEE